MADVYTCYIHKPGAMAPELRVVTCQSERELPDAIGVQMRTWGAFEKIEVYNADDCAVFTFTFGAQPAH